MRKFHFISGLPRSGSTLLANILAQNPHFASTSTSGVLDVMFGVRNQWDQLIEFKAAPNDEAKKRVMRGILESFYADVDKEVIFDKSRGWLGYIEMAEHVLGEKVKILVPIRDTRDILSSFEKLHRKASKDTQTIAPGADYFLSQTVQGRCHELVQGNATFGLAYNRIKDAIQRGLSDRMLLIDFDALSNDPTMTMKKIYEFLGEEYYPHDFDNVVQVTHEDDRVHGFIGMHDIRQKVAPVPKDWPRILGEWADEYKKYNLVSYPQVV